MHVYWWQEQCHNRICSSELLCTLLWLVNLVALGYRPKVRKLVHALYHGNIKKKNIPWTLPHEQRLISGNLAARCGSVVYKGITWVITFWMACLRLANLVVVYKHSLRSCHQTSCKLQLSNVLCFAQRLHCYVTASLFLMIRSGTDLLSYKTVEC